MTEKPTLKKQTYEGCFNCDKKNACDFEGDPQDCWYSDQGEEEDYA